MRVVGMILTLTLAAGLIVGCSRTEQPTSGKVQVMGSIFPLADVLSEIGGGYVAAASLLEPGTDPHSFSPKPSDAQVLMHSRLLVVIGMGIDQWANRAADRARTSRVTVLTLTDTPEFRRLLNEQGNHKPDAAAPQGDLGADPHVWLDPVFMQVFTLEMARALEQLDPAHADFYRQQADRYVGVLKQLDQEYRDQLSTVRNRDFVTFHEAFYYICRRYGLREYALEDADAQGFGPQQLRQLQDAIRQHNIRAIFAEPQFDAQRLEALAAGTGATVGRIDDLGNPSIKGYDHYVSLMRSNLAALVNALKE